jgi:PKD repeat protein
MKPHWLQFIMKMPVVQFESATSSTNELSTNAIIRVTLNTAFSQAVTLNYSVGGEATIGEDYEGLTGTVTIPPGETSASISVKPIRDNVLEAAESLVLTLTSASNATLGDTTVHTLAIADQSQPYIVSPITVNINPAAVGDWIQFTTQISSSLPLVFTWTFGDGTTFTGDFNTAHNYSAPGDYLVTVTATTPDGASVTSEIHVLIQNANAPGARLPMSVHKLLGFARYNIENKDSCTVAGVLSDAEVNSFSGLDFTINAGGASTLLQLNSKGKGKNDCCKAQIKRVKKSKNLVFIATLKGSFAQNWKSLGIDAQVNATNIPISIPVQVTLGGNSFALDAAALYSSKAFKQGRFRLKY